MTLTVSPEISACDSLFHSITNGLVVVEIYFSHEDTSTERDSSLLAGAPCCSTASFTSCRGTFLA